MTSQVCDFCDMVRWIKKNHKSDKQFREKLNVRLVQRTYDKELKQYCGTIQHKLVELHYCPLCGTKIK